MFRGSQIVIVEKKEETKEKSNNSMTNRESKNILKILGWGNPLDY